MIDPRRSRAGVADALAVLGAREVQIDLCNLDELFRHKLVDAAKERNVAPNKSDFFDVVFVRNLSERTYNDDYAYINRPCRLNVSTMHTDPFGPGATVCVAVVTSDCDERSPRNQCLRPLGEPAALAHALCEAAGVVPLIADLPIGVEVSLRGPRPRTPLRAEHGRSAHGPFRAARDGPPDGGGDGRPAVAGELRLRRRQAEPAEPEMMQGRLLSVLFSQA